MSRRNQNNIGQTNQTSVKVHHNPGGKTNWSFGWGNEEEKKPVEKPTVTVNKYHNESHFQMGDPTQQLEDQQKKRQQQRRKKEEQINSKLPSYDPRNGNKTSIVFGDDKPDYRKKDEVVTSVKVRAPPGGRSNIQFG